MSRVNTKNRYSAFFIAILVILIFFIANLFSLFEPFNAHINDAFMRYAPATPASDKVIVIQASQHYSHQGDEVWLPLLNSLLKENVQQVVFNFFPEQVSKKFYQLAAASNKVVFARRFVSPSSYLNKPVLQAIPESAQGESLNFGLIQELKNHSGVYRNQRALIHVAGENFPSLELLSAKRVLLDQSRLPKSDFEINFSGGLNRLPTLNIERVLSKGLVSELVAGRSVLVGVHDLEVVNRYFTPISSQQGLLSAVLFHAFALDTLLSDRLLNPIPRSISWALIILLILGSLFIFQWLSFRMSLVVATLLSLAYIFLSWLSLHHLFLFLPVSELLLAQWLTFTLVWRCRLVQEKHFIDNMACCLGKHTLG